MAAKKALNRATMLREVADKTGMAKKEVEAVWDHAIREIMDAVKNGQKVALTGFGRFSQRVTAARKAGMQKNPFTGEMVKVAARPARKAPRFAPAKPFKEYVAGSLKLAPVGAAKTAKKGPAKKKTAKKAAAKKKGPAKKRR